MAADDPNYQDKAVADFISDWRQWTITATTATVTFDAYAIGSYAEGPYECVFEMAKLKALAKPSALLP